MDPVHYPVALRAVQEDLLEKQPFEGAFKEVGDPAEHRGCHNMVRGDSAA